ncbi:MAG: cytochrome C oxidase subunit II [Alphaproteobacteria bacterium]|nr:cytochrome C oxidase subunit II [Alphaproteobacteria bacterium]MBF0129837.1 cytochrome C oxidase subunit II [Alphaproteobacteria bacterium]
MSIFPPKERLWWNEPIERSEVLWIGLAFVWAMIMFAMMPFWHLSGGQNLSNEAYRVVPEAYGQKVEAAAAKYKVGEDKASGLPIVRPPVGGDAYMLGRTYEWWPILELVKGQSYRLHLSSMDMMHGFSLQPVNINIQVHPDYEHVLTLTPTTSGEFTIVCNEFCGIGHHVMTGKIRVVDK